MQKTIAETETTMTDAKTIKIDSKQVACDGGGGALGHPRVFLEIGGNTGVTCPYCSRRFALRKGARVAASH